VCCWFSKRFSILPPKLKAKTVSLLRELYDAFEKYDSECRVCNDGPNNYENSGSDIE